MPPPTQYLTINDFRPGIIVDTKTGAAIIDSPPGTAAPGTVGCIANITGQLAPMYGGGVYQQITPNAHPQNKFFPAGIACVGPIEQTGDASLDDIHVWFSIV